MAGKSVAVKFLIHDRHLGAFNIEPNNDAMSSSNVFSINRVSRSVGFDEKRLGRVGPTHNAGTED